MNHRRGILNLPKLALWGKVGGDLNWANRRTVSLESYWREAIATNTPRPTGAT
ncbi:hypothetical protein NG799_21795 [Laspinema sp. D1]|uniref:Uncharacterized protein n=1 Tax=Laspinema palackyanum D2a TaxID=2953684 RepID=A0ABT2MW30_9CYAN|nr:hypothetical protein [Laspinema sp. D2a]